ncbi:ATP-dependent zinc metalloprotease FtsH [Heliorestis acidaminivorans]|uniref:ATP-dependent zinc metalloprotease FtsH n=1 Tax=Heliorestis acidaminivorans TaxID=553427 RepID=UPI0014787E6F|nr:ATP-dependent zinc metalloprotease FtsH [Heliorestis acidaminivorans]
MKKQKLLRIMLLSMVIVGTVLGWQYYESQKEEKEFQEKLIPFTTVYQKIEDGEITKVTMRQMPGMTRIIAENDEGETFYANGSPDNQLLLALIIEKEIEYQHEGPLVQKSINDYISMLISFLLIGALAFIGYYLFKQMNRFGINKARREAPKVDKPVLFSDVAGIDEVATEVEEIVAFLKTPEKFLQTGATIPRGVILSGPPGTGKTLIAKAVAGEAGVPFYSIAGSEFDELYVGLGALRVRTMFEEARKNAPCIIFIDEIDAMGKKRGRGIDNSVQDSTLNQLLVEMDGFKSSETVIIMAATNRLDVLDEALLRPGRFDRQIVVGLPDLKGREDIIAIHGRNKKLENLDYKTIAQSTPGFSGADLANLLNEAAILAARKNQKSITMSEVQEAIERIVAGPEKKSRRYSEDEKRLISIHEAGHAVAAYDRLKSLHHIQKVSIIPRGLAGGYTMIVPKRDRLLMTRQQVIDEIVVLLAGRSAEEIFTGEVTNGAANDLERATTLANKMVTLWGMSNSLGPISFSPYVPMSRTQQQVSETKLTHIDKEVEAILSDCYQQAKNIIKKEQEATERIVTALLEKETLDAKELEELIIGS